MSWMIARESEAPNPSKFSSRCQKPEALNVLNPKLPKPYFQSLKSQETPRQRPFGLVGFEGAAVFGHVGFEGFVGFL